MVDVSSTPRRLERLRRQLLLCVCMTKQSHVFLFVLKVAPSWKAYEDSVVDVSSTPRRLERLRRQLDYCMSDD